MELFTDEVYRALEAGLEKPVGLEGALRSICQDTRLQELLRGHAAKNGVREVVIWSDGKKQRPSSLYLAPGTKTVAAPVYFAHYEDVYHDDPRDGGWSTYEERASRVREVKGKSGYFVASGPYRGTRVMDVPELAKVTGKDVLDGLERAIKKLTEE